MVFKFNTSRTKIIFKLDYPIEIKSVIMIIFYEFIKLGFASDEYSNNTLKVNLSGVYKYISHYATFDDISILLATINLMSGKSKEYAYLS